MLSPDSIVPRFLSFADRVSGATGFVGACLVIPLASVMFYEVVLRFFFDLPTFWAYELAYMMTGAHFALGIGYVLREGRHVRVDFLYAALPPRARALVDLFGYALLLPVAAWLSAGMARVAWVAWVKGEVSGESAWNPVMWPLFATVCIGLFVFTLQVVAETVRAFAAARRVDDGTPP